MFKNTDLGADPPERRLSGLIGLLLALVTLLAFWPVLRNGFLKFDDQQYITENPHVRTGLNWANVAWAFGSGYASNWHPLTWVSHMLDVQLFGLRPAWHHFVSLLLHIANTLLLFLLLRRLTGAQWRSALVAALFAVHPLHVESVAWAAERKDVLSMLFFLLTLWAYAAYVEQSRAQSPAPAVAQPSTRPPATDGSRLTRYLPRAYFWSLLFFALGLMSKPMLVTLPCVLLLLDFWPLGRIEPDDPAPPVRKFLALLQEKVPFLVLALGSCLITFLVQQQTHAMVKGLPLALRLANAVASYGQYLAKACWPTHLAVFYPHPDARYFSPPTDPSQPLSRQWPLWAVLLAALLLAGVTALVWVGRRRVPWWTTGWCWYLGTLVPVIGLVQVGSQAMADRYTYIPMMGIFVGLSWTAWTLVEHGGWPKAWVASVAVLAVGACALQTHQQVQYWRDNLTLFSHALAVTSHNAVAEANVGASLAELGKLDLAVPHLRAAVAADPQYPDGHLYLGLALALQGHPEEALVEYQTTLQLRPWDEIARLHLARLLQASGQAEKAAAHYQQLLRLNPSNLEAQFQLGLICFGQGDLPGAAAHFEQAARLKPDYIEALIQLGRVQAGLGRFGDAERSFRQAVALNPTNANLHINLGNALMLSGQTEAARAAFAQALRLDADLPGKFLREGQALAARGNFNTALPRFKTAWWLKPEDAQIKRELAWLLATHPMAKARDGALALRLAQQAIDSGGGTEARFWAALDVAYAENGQFDEAQQAAEKARDLARAAGQTEAAQAAEARLALYRQGQPYHQ